MVSRLALACPNTQECLQTVDQNASSVQSVQATKRASGRNAETHVPDRAALERSAALSVTLLLVRVQQATRVIRSQTVIQRHRLNVS